MIRRARTAAAMGLAARVGHAKPRKRRSGHLCLSGILVCALPLTGAAQLSLSAALSLATHNSPRVKLAEDDVAHARAVLAENRDAFVPHLGIGGGAGDSYGITLTVPTIFTVSAQSLVFSYSQRSYVRAAHMDLDASLLALADARAAVQEDTVASYLTLSYLEQEATLLEELYSAAERLREIVRQRFDAGLENAEGQRDAQRTVLQTRLHALQLKDQIKSLREHLGTLLGIARTRVDVEAGSIPALPPLNSDGEDTPRPDSAAVLSAKANAEARKERAFGDSRYLFRPQIVFGAQYGRVSPINDVSEYYDLHGNYNTASFGLQVQVPLLDAGHKARVQEEIADAHHSEHDVLRLREQQREEQLALSNTLGELAIKKDLAELDQQSAEAQLKAVLIEVSSGGYGGTPKTPKEEQQARIRERQSQIDLLEARLQLAKSQVFLLRQTGQLEQWLAAR